MTAVGNYQGWLFARAAKILDGGWGDPNLEDVVQEGRIAMWKQEIKHGREHSGFMTSQAALRMGQVARGEKAFGGIKVAVRDVKPVINLEAIDAALAEAMAPRTEDFAEFAAMAYHHGQINQAISSLPEKQGEAARVVLAGGILNAQQRANWVDARRKLAKMLEHLDG